MKQLFVKPLFAAAFLTAVCACSVNEPMDKLTDRVFDRARVQYTAMDSRVAPDMMPVTFENGVVKDGDITWWTSGFFPGTLWLIYEYTGDEAFRNMAVHRNSKLDSLIGKKTHHDIGFQIYCSYGNGYRLTGEPAYLDMVRKGAEKLCTRFSPVVGCTRSWDPGVRWNYPVIIDNMMNLEILTAASRLTGEDKYATVARTHANTTLKNHFREDGSSWHVVSYDEETGEVINKLTAQGFCDGSAWSRGQAWGLYGYTMMYRETGDDAYLEQARKCASFIISMLPEDGVPEWDFNAPGTAHAMDMGEAGAPEPSVWKWRPGDPVLRDSSAGAIIASALVELSTFSEGREAALYRKWAERIIRTLASPEYLAAEGENGNFLLKHGVQDLHGGVGIDIPLNYADYYFLEALIRYNKSFN